MTQSRLASAKITKNTNQLVYTVPAGKSLVGSLFIRNFNADGNSANIDIATTQGTLGADYQVAALSSNTTNFTSNTTVPIGQPIDGQHLAQGGRLTGDFRGNYSYGNQYGHYDETSDTATYNVYNNQHGSGQYIMNNQFMTGNYQISGFYTKQDDYLFIQQNRQPRIFNNYPWTYTTSNNFSDNSGGNIAGGYSNDLDYYNWGGQGFRNIYISMNDDGYTTYMSNISKDPTSFSGNKYNESNTSQSFYWQQSQIGGKITQGSMSLIPTAPRTSGSGLWAVVHGNYSSNGSMCMQWMPVYDSSGSHINGTNNRAGWYGQVNALATTDNESEWYWIRPVGNYVYCASASQDVFRAPLSTNLEWQTQSNWSKVTSSVVPSGKTINEHFPFIETTEGIGYGACTDGSIITSLDQGATWTQGDLTSITGVSTTAGAQVGGKNAAGAFVIYSADGRYDMSKAIRSNLEDAVEVDLSLSAKGHLEHRGIILNAGDKVYVQSSQDDVVAQLYGYEE